MENPVLDSISRHTSIRRYSQEPVPASTIETIVQAAQRASTSSNMQAYSVISVTDPSRRQKLADLCGNQQFIAKAPVFLAWLADLARLDRACEMRHYEQVTEHVESFLVAAVDCAIAAQTAALAAESIGLGICYIGSIRNNPRQVIELLGLPRLTFPITGMTIGWPDGMTGLKPRLPLAAILHQETYDQEQDDYLLEYDRTMAASGIYKERQIPAPGRVDITDEYGWLEHTSRRVSKEVRTGLRSVLEEQGFHLR